MDGNAAAGPQREPRHASGVSGASSLIAPPARRPLPRSHAAMLYEPQLAPPLPDLMLLDEEDPCLSWPRLASFAPATGSSAPVPIAAPRDAVRCTLPTAASLGSDLVDSMESTQTLLGASLRQEAAASAEQPTMRFVPVEATPAPYPQPYPQPQPLPQLRRSLPSTEWLYGGYGVIAEPQTHPRERATEPSGWAGQEGSGHGMQLEDEAHCYGRQPQPAYAHEQPRSYGSGWELPPASLPARHASGYASAAHAGGTSSLSMSFPYSTQLGRHLPAPVRHCVLGCNAVAALLPPPLPAMAMLAPACRSSPRAGPWRVGPLPPNAVVPWYHPNALHRL